MYKVIVFFSVIVLLPFIAQSQTTKTKAKTKTTIQLGTVKVWLGMDKNELLSMFDTQYYKVQEMQDGSIYISEKPNAGNDKYKSIGWVYFHENNTVAGVNSCWDDKYYENSTDLIHSLYFFFKNEQFDKIRIGLRHSEERAYSTETITFYLPDGRELSIDYTNAIDPQIGRQISVRENLLSNK